MPSDVCRKLIQNSGKGEIKEMIIFLPALGLNGDMKLEGGYVNGGDMNREGASGDGDGDNI